MDQFKLRTFHIFDIDAIDMIEKKYQKLYPDATYSWIEAYLSNPHFTYDHRIFCLVDSEDELIGFGHILPVISNHDTEAHKLFIHIKIDPDHPNQTDLKNQLYNQILSKAQEIISAYNLQHVKLFVQYFASEYDSIDYFQKKGFSLFRKHEFKSRNLLEELPPIPSGIKMKAWVPKNLQEKLDYLYAKQLAFPNAPLSIEDLDFQMHAPLWLLISAFSEQNDIVGSIMLLQPPWEENHVFTEDIFVIPSAKHKGIARAMNIYAFHELKQRGKTHAMLTVHSENIAAKTLSESLGYRTIKDELFLAKDI